MSWMLQEVCHEGKLNIQAPIWFHYGTREPKNMLIKECFFELCSWWLIHVQMYMLLVENAKDPLQCQSYMYTTRYKATESELCSIVFFGHQTVFKNNVFCPSPGKVRVKWRESRWLGWCECAYTFRFQDWDYISPIIYKNSLNTTVNKNFTLH